MTKENKLRLSLLYRYDQLCKHPTVPVDYLPKPSYTDKTANGLTKAIKDFINFSGYQAERISSMGRMIDKRKTVTDVLGRNIQVGSMQYIKGTSTNGTADISATIKGRSVKIEVKIGKDKQSEEQKQYEQDVIKAGGLYFIARDFDSFIEWYDKIILEL